MTDRKVTSTVPAERIELIPPSAPSGALWRPRVGPETIDLLESLKIPQDGRRRVQDEAVRVLSKCVPPAAPAGSEVGLVIGYVQSGKTLSFTTVAALARDNGYQMVIVITGISVPLLSQSTDRLVNDLRLASRRDRKWQRFINPTPSGNDISNISNTLSDWDDKSVPEGHRRTVLITVMKNVLHLDSLTEVLSKIPLEGRPVLVIDDEADQASLNTGVRQGKESATYGRLLSLRRALPHHTFLQYTATPQAPLLINLIDALSPRFAELLTPGADYVGGRAFFVDFPGLVRTIPDAEVPSADNVLDGPPESLSQALRLFFLGVAAGFIRDDGRGNRSMLVHPSQRTYDHGQYFNWVRAARDGWAEILGLPESEPDRREVVEDFRNAYEDLTETASDLPPFADLVGQLRRAIRNTRIEEVNTRGGNTPQIDWATAYPFILVGGQAMDRGFTVEGLTVTYMPRGIGVGNADNVQQRARFLGYKKPYLGYCRVFLESSARAAYRNYVMHEEDIRGRLESHINANRPLPDWKREFFLTSQLKPTRRSVQGLDYMRIKFGDEWWNPGVPHDTADGVAHNRAVVGSFLESLALHADAGDPRRTKIMKHRVATGVPLADAFDRLLTPYAVTSQRDSQEFTALRLVVGNYLEDDPEATCTVYEMSGGATRERSAGPDGRLENLFQGPHPDTRGAIYPGDRKIRSPEGITIQVHRLAVLDGRDRFDDVPTLAVWIPRDIAPDLIVQDTGKQ